MKKKLNKQHRNRKYNYTAKLSTDISHVKPMLPAPVLKHIHIKMPSKEVRQSVIDTDEILRALFPNAIPVDKAELEVTDWAGV